VKALQPTVGFAPAACGGDIQFLEAIERIGAEPRLVLPFRGEDFVHTSVAFAGKEWVQRFRRLLAAHEPVEVTEDPFLGEDVLYTHGFEVMLGMALMEGRRRGEDVCVVVARDQDAQIVEGGTQHMLSRWAGRNLRTEIVEIGRLRRQYASRAAQAPPAPADLPEPAHQSFKILREMKAKRQVRTMLFADMRGFSTLDEEQSPAFFLHFLATIKLEIQNSTLPPSFVNTWGDGLFVVFDDIGDAADFAVRLRDAVRHRDWTEVGLPDDMGMRLGMHTGPVFEAQDPVIDSVNFFGFHVNRAARIEPLAGKNEIWCSEQAAALLEAQGVPTFYTEFLGEHQLPKAHGKIPLYRLERDATP